MCPDPQGGGEGIPGRGSSVSKGTEDSDCLGRRICMWPASLNHKIPGLSEMGLDSQRGRSICKSCDQRRS